MLRVVSFTGEHIFEAGSETLGVDSLDMWRLDVGRRVGDRPLKSDTGTQLPSIFIFLQVAFFSVSRRVFHACKKCLFT